MGAEWTDCYALVGHRFQKFDLLFRVSLEAGDGVVYDFDRFFWIRKGLLILPLTSSSLESSSLIFLSFFSASAFCSAVNIQIKFNYNTASYLTPARSHFQEQSRRQGRKGKILDFKFKFKYF